MSEEKQTDWTEEAEWTKAPPRRTAEGDRANELLQAGYMMAVLREQLTMLNPKQGRIHTRIFLHALRPGVAAELAQAEHWPTNLSYVQEEWEAVKAHDQRPIT